MENNEHQSALHVKGKKIEAEIELAYRKPVAQKAKEGSSPILFENDEIKAIPAVELLKDLK